MDHTASALDPKHGQRTLKQIQYLVVHRTLDGSINDLIRAFKDTTKFAAGWYTGGKFPYHFIIDRNAALHQMLPLTRIGPAAKATLNLAGIHVAVQGDFRKERPTEDQLYTLRDVCIDLLEAMPALQLGGHTEFAGASDDPNKQCPGKHLDMNSLRAFVGNREPAAFLTSLAYVV